MKDGMRFRKTQLPPGREMTRLLALGVAALILLVAATAATGNRGEAVGQFGFDPAVPDEVWESARAGLVPFLEAIPEEELVDYGMPTREGFGEVSLGEPYRVLTIHPKALATATGSEDIRSLLTSTTMWFFPVRWNERPGTILTVDLMDGRWQAVGIGRSTLAAELGKAEVDWPDGEGYRRTLVLVPQATSDLVLITRGDSASLLALRSARLSLNLDHLEKRASQLYNAAEVIPRLAKVVEANINQGID